MNTTARILDKVDSPKDLKALNAQELNLLADEMRELIIKKSKHNRRTFRPEFRNC